MPNSHRNHFCAYAVMWKKVSGSGTCVQASPIGSAQVETLKHIRAFSIDSRARLVSLPEPKRTDDRDEVHDLKKMRAHRSRLRRFCQTSRNFFFSSLPHFWRKSFSGLLAAAMLRQNVSWEWICFIFFKITFLFKSLPCYRSSLID